MPRLRERGVPGIERIWLGIVKPVLPALLPGDIGCQRSFEVFPGHKALKTQTGGRVAHNQDPLTFPAERQIGEKSAHPVCRLAPTLTTGVRTIEVSGPITMHLGRSGAVELPVVTLSQSPVLENGYGRGSEGHLHRLDRSRQVRHEDGRQPVVAAPPAEQHGIRASRRRRDGREATRWPFPSRCPRWLRASRRQSRWPQRTLAQETNAFRRAGRRQSTVETVKWLSALAVLE